MDEPVTSAEASRRLQRILSLGVNGHDRVVTGGCLPVARFAAVDAVGARSREALFARLRQQVPVQGVRWVRAELYDRGA